MILKHSAQTQAEIDKFDEHTRLVKGLLVGIQDREQLLMSIPRLEREESKDRPIWESQLKELRKRLQMYRDEIKRLWPGYIALGPLPIRKPEKKVKHGKPKRTTGR